MKTVISSNNKSKHIIISNDNYDRLKKFGKFGDTFDDIVTRILKCKVGGM